MDYFEEFVIEEKTVLILCEAHFLVICCNLTL